MAFDKPIIFLLRLDIWELQLTQILRNKMSSVKRRKIEEDSSLGPANIKKKQKGTFPTPTTTSASPEPARSDQEPQKDAPIQKSFKDLVCPSILVDKL